MAQHVVVKAEKIAESAAVSLAEEMVLPALFQRETFDKFKGAKDDAVNIKVPGVLPFRTYGWRNDRSTELQFDTLSERKIAINFGDDIYSGVALTDEQAAMDDLGDWSKLVGSQVEAVGKGLEWEAAQEMIDAPYAITLGVASNALRAGFIRARGISNKIRMPKGRRFMVVGQDWEAAILNDEKLTLASAVGEGRAVTSLSEATLGRLYGWEFVVAEELPATMAIGMHESAFVFVTGAPAVPQSAGFGATASYDGISLRWVKGFDIKKAQELSVVNAYKGFRNVVDPLLGVDDATGQAYVSAGEHFVRAIKLTLGGADSLPNGTTGRAGEGFTAAEDDELASITGVGTPAA